MFTRKQKRVRVAKDIDLQPWTTLKRGEEGTVVALDTDGSGIVSADILMDTKHAGLNRWGNEAHIAGPELEALVFWERSRPRAVTLCLSTIVAAFVGTMISSVAFAEAVDIFCNRVVETAFRAFFTG